VYTPAAYLTIIIVWSTTPLAISWRAEAISPVAALGLRMGLAALVGLAVLRMLGLKIEWHADAVRTYGYSQLGIVGAMLCVYSASQFLPSGLISVLFALSPMFSAVFAYFILREDNFSADKIVAFVVAFAGLSIISADAGAVHQDGFYGVALLLIGVALYSLSGVKVQQIAYRGNPFVITVASVAFSTPLFAVAWIVLDGQTVNFEHLVFGANNSLIAIGYLALFGSLIGFCAYFYLLKQAGAAAVAMVTLLTPALALLLGAGINGEPLTWSVYIGTTMILSGLFVFHRKLLVPNLRKRRW